MLFPCALFGAGVSNPESDTYFSAEQFAQCLSDEMTSYFSRDSFSKRIQAIHEIRSNLAQRDSIQNNGLNCELFCKGLGPTASRLFHSIGCWFNSQIVASLMLHSGPLVLSHPKFDGLVRPEMSVHQIRDTIVKNTGGPLREWLNQQPEKSVSHWKLFMEAQKLFEDPFVALGAIGDLFENEREWCDRSAKSGNKKCELSNKMRPLITPTDVDPVGRNYHFWAHLNMVWKSSGSKEKAASYLIEIWKDNDIGDHTSNLLGIDTSTRAYKLTYFKLTKTGKKLFSPKCDLL